MTKAVKKVVKPLAVAAAGLALPGVGSALVGAGLSAGLSVGTTAAAISGVSAAGAAAVGLSALSAGRSGGSTTINVNSPSAGGTSGGGTPSAPQLVGVNAPKRSDANVRTRAAQLGKAPAVQAAEAVTEPTVGRAETLLTGVLGRGIRPSEERTKRRTLGAGIAV